MRQFRVLLALAIALGIGGAAWAASSPTIVMPAQLKWQPQPGNYSMAVLYGNPGKSGYYVIRLKLPPNWTFGTHYHPAQENVTVISGTFYAGLGSKMDKSKVTAFPAGSFVAMPPNVRHYALTKSEGAVIQIDGQGPSKDIMVKM
ncbi:MAG TPA: cupin domain-containing protein [Candidatus Baltobacteraceae bacterium]|nr:cupin domain-containing protein [Candidatus Baltobacteraceae bacterium]